ncbi:MAG: glycine/sarcosine/betaine reductase selenoprotein B family protein [Anaerolineae bacterium]
MPYAMDIPDGAHEVLAAWQTNPAVVAALARADWKAAFSDYPYLEVTDTPPFTPFTKPLASAKIAVVTTGGIYIDGQQPAFDAANPLGDATIRYIPIDTPYSRLKIAHDHYDHTAPNQDLSTINPVQNLRILCDEGLFRTLANPLISAHGYIPLWPQIFDQLIPAVIESLHQSQPDGVLLVPV